jgi:hypothetical protein
VIIELTKSSEERIALNIFGLFIGRKKDLAIRDSTRLLIRGDDDALLRQEVLDQDDRILKYEPESGVAMPWWAGRFYFLILVSVLGISAALLAIPSRHIVTNVGTIKPRKECFVVAKQNSKVLSVNAYPGNKIVIGDLLVELESLTLESRKYGLVSPCGGTFGGAFTRRGMVVEPGEVVASIIDEISGYEVVATFPSAITDQFLYDSTVDVEVDSERDIYASLPVERIDRLTSSVSSPYATRIHVRLPDRPLHSTRFYNGATAKMDVHIAEPIGFLLFPHLRRLVQWRARR